MCVGACEKKKPFGDPENAVVEENGREVCPFASPFPGVTQMVKDSSKHTRRTSVPQGSPKVGSEPNKIAAKTPFDFSGKNLTPYGGLLPVATMLEKLGFKQLVEETLTVHRIPRAMSIYQFLLAMVLAIYVGFSRLNHLRFVAQDPMLTGVLQVGQLPPQSTFWRFLASLHGQVAKQLLSVQRVLRQRVWEAAHVQLDTVTLDTDTTVHTLYGKQMGGRRSYNPKNKGKKSYQPILTFLAETREYVGGELRNGDRPTGQQIARHLESVFAALPVRAQDFCSRRMLASIAGRRSKPMRRAGLLSSSWRARPHACCRNCKRLTGSLRPRPMP